MVSWANVRSSCPFPTLASICDHRTKSKSKRLGSLRNKRPRPPTKYIKRSNHPLHYPVASPLLSSRTVTDHAIPQPNAQQQHTSSTHSPRQSQQSTQSTTTSPSGARCRTRTGRRCRSSPAPHGSCGTCTRTGCPSASRRDRRGATLTRRRATWAMCLGALRGGSCVGTMRPACGGLCGVG